MRFKSPAKAESNTRLPYREYIVALSGAAARHTFSVVIFHKYFFFFKFFPKFFFTTDKQDNKPVGKIELHRTKEWRAITGHWAPSEATTIRQSVVYSLCQQRDSGRESSTHSRLALNSFNRAQHRSSCGKTRKIFFTPPLRGSIAKIVNERDLFFRIGKQKEEEAQHSRQQRKPAQPSLAASFNQEIRCCKFDCLLVPVASSSVLRYRTPTSRIVTFCGPLAP